MDLSVGKDTINEKIDHFKIPDEFTDEEAQYAAEQMGY